MVSSVLLVSSAIVRDDHRQHVQKVFTHHNRTMLTEMNTRPALIAMVAVLVITAIAPGVTGQSEATAVGFGDTQAEVAQGDVATISVQLQNTDTATLQIASADQEYTAVLRVDDRDGDGTVGVRFNTFRAASDVPEDALETATAADDVDVIRASYDEESSVLDVGRYNLILSTTDIRIASQLSLVAPGNVTGSTATVVPADTPLPASDSFDTNRSSGENGTIAAAAGDSYRASFGVRGVGGIVAGDAPAHNLVFPTNSTPGVKTMHSVSTSPNTTIELQSVTLDYRTDESIPARGIYRLSKSSIEVLGVDTTGDGYVDRSALATVQSVKTTSSGQLTLTFDRTVTVEANETFLMSYPARNPDTTDPQAVSVTLKGDETTHRERGHVQYGPAGQGTLGYGVDLRIDSASRDGPPTDPLAAVTTVYDSTTESLVADADTTALERGEHTVRLSVGNAAPEPVPRANLTERMVVVEPTAEFTQLSMSNASRLTVAVETNLAPENSLIIPVRAQQSDEGIRRLSNCVATVGPDRTSGCDFDFERSPADLNINVSVRHDGAVIAGPVRYNESDSSNG